MMKILFSQIITLLFICMLGAMTVGNDRIQKILRILATLLAVSVWVLTISAIWGSNV